MTPETARLLAQSLKVQSETEQGMLKLLSRRDIETPKAATWAMITLATSYVHEQRIINRIVEDDRDD